MEQPIDEIRRLKACINDLIGVLAIPAISTGHDSAKIIATLLDVLISMLNLDFAYARLSDSGGGQPQIEMVQLPRFRNVSAKAQEIGEILDPWLSQNPGASPLVMPNPIGDGVVQIAHLRLELQQEVVVLAAGSRQPSFPSGTEMLILRVAANQAAIQLQEARLLSEQKKLEQALRKSYGVLEERVAERTSELSRANEVLKAEIAERMRIEKALNRLNAELEQRVAARTALLDAKTKDLEAFTYSVAHDLKAPLRGINGYSRLLLENDILKADKETQSLIFNIMASTERMDQLIDDLLSYSRLERRELRSSRVELRPFVEALVEERRPELEARRIKLTLQVGAGTVWADTDGLAQAFRNYLDNAIKFTRDAAQPCVEVGADERDGSCYLWVRDNGIGFDGKQRDRIFEIFQRLNREQDYPGTGIGLAIARKAMERMGGRAWAESAAGQGATFYLEIPRYPFSSRPAE